MAVWVRQSGLSWNRLLRDSLVEVSADGSRISGKSESLFARHRSEISNDE